VPEFSNTSQLIDNEIVEQRYIYHADNGAGASTRALPARWRFVPDMVYTRYLNARCRWTDHSSNVDQLWSAIAGPCQTLHHTEIDAEKTGKKKSSSAPISIMPRPGFH
jgi:hypothetical protein